MTIMKLLSVSLILSFMRGTLCVSYTRTKKKLERWNGENIKLLRSMGGSFPHECLAENPGKIFRDTMYKPTETPNERTELSMAYETLRSVEKIFEKDLSFTSWKREQFFLFDNIIKRQIKELRNCLGEPLSDPSGTTYPDLEKYFERLNIILGKEQTRCAWEIVRKEVLHSMEYLRKFYRTDARRR